MDQALPQHRTLRVVLDLTHLVVMALLVMAVLGQVGIGPVTSQSMHVTFLAVAGLLLVGQGYMFAALPWRALRGSGKGTRVLDRASGDPKLLFASMVSLLALVAVIALELGAFLVFLQAVPPTGVVATFATVFLPLVAAVQLVQMLAIVSRELTPSMHKPRPWALVMSKILSPIAALLLVVATLLALDVHGRLGIMGGVLPRQAVHVLAVAVGLEFIALRIRLRLPPVRVLFQGVIEQSLRMEPGAEEVLRRRATWTYIAAFVFVAASMGFAAIVATGALALPGAGFTVTLVVFYVIIALMVLGIVALRAIQAARLRRADEEDELEMLRKRRRIDPRKASQYALMGLGGLIALAAVAVAILTWAGRMPWGTTYGTDALIVAMLAGVGPYGWFNLQDRRRIEAIDRVFPDFLGDIAESARTGLTLPRALVTAAKGDYGYLTPHVRKMAAQVQWGIPFDEAFRRFGAQVETPLINRSVTLIMEAQRAGGDVAEILSTAADDAREIHQLLHERSEQMKMYSLVVVIAFFVFIGVVMVLVTKFLPAFQAAATGTAGAQVGGISIQQFDPEDFHTVFFHAAIIQSVGGGLVGGVLTRGHVTAGFPSAAFMLAVSWVAFRLIGGV